MESDDNGTKTIIALDGKKEATVEFVRLSRSLNHSVEKANPLSLDNKMARCVVSDDNPEYPFIRRALQEFREKNNLHYWFLSEKIEGSGSDVVILVNVPKGTLELLKEDFGIFSIFCGEGNGYSEKRHDYNLVQINKEGVERTLRILSK